MKSNNLKPLSADLDADRIDLNKLRTFSVIAERGGVSAAAEKLALTRSAVSHSLSSLESSLGVTLFHRVGKRLVLTREGTALQRAYGDAHDCIHQALETIGEEIREVRGWIRLGLYPGFSRFRLAGMIEGFLGEHPNAHCRLVHGSRQVLLEDLLAGRLDFTLSLRPSEVSPSRRIESLQLFEHKMVLAVSTRLGRVRKGMAAIAALPIVDYFRSEPLIDRWIAHHHGKGRSSRSSSQRNVRVWVGSGTDLALELTRRGVGACVLPADLVEPYRKLGELKIIPGPGAGLRSGIWLNQLAGARRNAIQQAFREVLVQRATPHLQPG